MKYSIKKQFAGIFIALMAGTILLCWFLNSSFLEKYYITEKKQALLEAYLQLNLAAQNQTFDSDDTDIVLQQISAKHNLAILVVDADSKTIQEVGNSSDFMKDQLMRHLFLPSDEQTMLMEKTSKYTIQRLYDSKSRMEYIEIWGILDNSNFFIARTALESIRDSVEIANRFLAYIGIISAIVGSIIIWFVSSKVTNPVLELTRISDRMIHLDFDARYRGNSKNELALLGTNINTLAETLEETISELKTANNELKKDIEKKEQIDEMRKEFLANVSHELKTPIALIQGYAEGLLEGMGDDQESREFYCNVIADEAAKMNNMVKKLLTLNQLESGNDVVTMERFDITALARNYIQSAEVLTRQQEIKVHFEQKAPIYVWGDEFKIEEVFNNYFSNAINHCAGNKEIDVTIQKINGKARVTVFNTGISIPEESLPLIWDKFYKIDKARTREYGGSGVGLSIVKAIMNSMNQQYGVQNYAEGVAFWFELELVEEF